MCDCCWRLVCLQTSPAESVGTHVSLRKIAANDLSLRVGNDVVTPMDTVRNLRVILHSELTMQRHVNKVASACFYYIHRVKQIRWLLGPASWTRSNSHSHLRIRAEQTGLL